MSTSKKNGAAASGSDAELSKDQKLAASEAEITRLHTALNAKPSNPELLLEDPDADAHMLDGGGGYDAPNADARTLGGGGSYGGGGCYGGGAWDPIHLAQPVSKACLRRLSFDPLAPSASPFLEFRVLGFFGFRV